MCKPESVVDGKLSDRPATVIPLELQDACAVHNWLDTRHINHIVYEKIDGNYRIPKARCELFVEGGAEK